MEIKYMASITKQELDDSVVILCFDETSHPCIVIKNSQNKVVKKTMSTDNLEIKENGILECEGEKYLVHIIRSKSPMSSDFEVIYDYVFNNIKESIDDESLDLLVNSLDEYFRITPEVEKERLQIGVYGELLTILELNNNGYPEITKKYHKDFYSKHDVEISNKLRLEIKTTNKESRIHTFKHNQISRDDVEVYVASSIVEKSSEGKSLYSLFTDVKNLYDDYTAKFELEKLKKRCGVSEDNEGIKISYDKARSDLKFYHAKNLPMITETIPKGITNVQYDTDCSLADDIQIAKIIDIFNS